MKLTKEEKRKILKVLEKKIKNASMSDLEDALNYMKELEDKKHKLKEERGWGMKTKLLLKILLNQKIKQLDRAIIESNKEAEEW